MKNDMNRLSNEQIMDYLDGTLDAKEMARVESHLKQNTADAELVSEMRFALGAVKEWHTGEPMQVSENFWPKLRDNLGPAPKRSAWSQLKNQIAGVFGPSRSARLSFGAAFAAIVIAASAFLFAPKDASQTALADKQISVADRAFIQQAQQKHEAYVQTQPVAGDASSLETGEDDENEPEIP